MFKLYMQPLNTTHLVLTQNSTPNNIRLLRIINLLYANTISRFEPNVLA